MFFVFCVLLPSMTMAATREIGCVYLPDGNVQWLRVKPWLCLIRQCAPHCTDASAWPSIWPGNLVYFFIVN